MHPRSKKRDKVVEVAHREEEEESCEKAAHETNDYLFMDCVVRQTTQWVLVHDGAWISIFTKVWK